MAPLLLPMLFGVLVEIRLAKDSFLEGLRLRLLSLAELRLRLSLRLRFELDTFDGDRDRRLCGLLLLLL